MASTATLGLETRAQKGKRQRDAQVGEAIPGLPNDVVVAHILTSESLPDPIDLARLTAVSRAMHDAVAATGRKAEETEPGEAAKLGCLSTLKHLHARGRLSDTTLLCEACASSGQLEELKALRADGCPWDEGTCSGAERSGHLEVLQCLRANGCPWHEHTCNNAAEGGHLEVLRWARANGCPCNDEDLCSSAAIGGNLEVLQWLRADGCPWNLRTCANAAWGGNLEVLQWLRANGCPWDEGTCASAARMGRLEMLLWARANGCPWDSDTCAYAA